MVVTENNPVVDTTEVKTKSKRIMAKFLLRYLSSETTRKILRLLAEGSSPSDVTKSLASLTASKRKPCMSAAWSHQIIRESGRNMVLARAHDSDGIEKWFLS